MDDRWNTCERAAPSRKRSRKASGMVATDARVLSLAMAGISFGSANVVSTKQVNNRLPVWLEFISTMTKLPLPIWSYLG